MVHRARSTVKPHASRFLNPPWGEQSPQWQQIDRQLPPEHPARLLRRALETLDLAALNQSYRGRGSLAYPPQLLLAIVLYELHRGVQSPAQWADDVQRRDDVKWLGFGIRPSRSRLYQFRDRLGPHLQDFHRQVLQRAIPAGLSPATRAALDGSTVPAAGSRRRMLNRTTLAKRLDQLDAAIAWEESGLCGPAPRRPWWMATTAAGRRRQRQRLQQAQQRLQERIAENAGRRRCKRRPADQIVISPSDPEAAVGLDKEQVYRPLFNVQIAYDLDSELILGYEVFAQSNDAGTLEVMLVTLTTQVGHAPAVLLTDSAYANVIDVGLCEAAGVTLYAPYQENDTTAARSAGREPKQLPKSQFRWDESQRIYHCPQGHAMPYQSSRTDRRAGGHQVVLDFYRCPGEHCRACPLRDRCTPNPQAGRSLSRARGEEVVERLKERMKAAESKALYRLRRQTVERGFADVKEHRGLRRLGCWGYQRAGIQVGLNVLSHNLWHWAKALARRDEIAVAC
jgi:transposase